jgi:hypothetical protein
MNAEKPDKTGILLGSDKIRVIRAFPATLK